MAFIKEIEKTNHSIRHRYASHDQSAPILRVDNLSVNYDSNAALDGISFELPRAIQLAIVGPNGAGKSTLFKVIAGVLPPTSGDVNVYGSGPRRHVCIAYIPQRSAVDWRFPVTVEDVVMMGRSAKLRPLVWPGKQDWKQVQDALAIVNMEELARRQISQLSGGQQQRMFIARALAQEAELMLMDEPLAGLDIPSQESLLLLLRQLKEKRVTIMVATHDLAQAARYFDRIMLLNHRLLGLGLATDVLKPEKLLQAYGGRLHRVEEDGSILTLDDTCCDGGDEHDHDH